MHVSKKQSGWRQLSTAIVIAVPTIVALGYLLFPAEAGALVRQACGLPFAPCVAADYYTDSHDPSLFSPLYGTSLEQVRRITPALWLLCLIVATAQVLGSDLHARANAAREFLARQVRRKNGYLVLLGTVASLPAFAYIMFVSRSLKFFVSFHWRSLLTAPISITVYWLLFILLCFSVAITLAVALLSLIYRPAHENSGQ